MLPKSIHLKLNSTKLGIQSDSEAIIIIKIIIYEPIAKVLGKATRPLPIQSNNLTLKAIQETLLNGFLIIHHSKSTPLHICNPCEHSYRSKDDLAYKQSVVIKINTSSYSLPVRKHTADE